MPLKYEIDSVLLEISSVLDEYDEWYGLVMRRIFYGAEYPTEEKFLAPVSFRGWASKAEDSTGVMEKESIARLRRIHDDLQKVSDAVQEEAIRLQAAPSLKSFDSFKNHYDEFIEAIHRFSRDYALAETGIDILTGLRSRRAMEYDLVRELDRLNRNGKPFCLVLATLTNIEALSKAMSEEEFQTMARYIADNMKRSVRSFDDVYRASENEFIMSLKHSDVTGGAVAVKRLRDYIKEGPLATQAHMQPNLAFCVAAPEPDDKLETLLNNMRADLNRYDGTGDAPLEYVEQSALQRYLKTNE